jgi:hypothetical protein
MFDQEALAKQAAERSVYRKKVRLARSALVPHLDEIVDYIEKLRGLSDIIADQNGVDKGELWDWVVREVTQ